MISSRHSRAYFRLARIVTVHLSLMATQIGTARYLAKGAELVLCSAALSRRINQFCPRGLSFLSNNTPRGCKNYVSVIYLIVVITTFFITVSCPLHLETIILEFTTVKRSDHFLNRMILRFPCIVCPAYIFIQIWFFIKRFMSCIICYNIII